MATTSRHRLVGAVTAIATLFGAIAVGSLDASAQANDVVTPAPGLKPRIYPAQAWTDKGLFVFGGQKPGGGDTTTYLNDGGIAAVKTGKTTKLPKPPFGPLFEPTAIQVGKAVMVIGPLCKQVIQSDGPSPGCSDGRYQAGIFDLKSKKWRKVALPEGITKFGPFGQGDYRVTSALGTTSTGTAVFALGPVRQQEYFAYAPATKKWTELPAPGVRVDAACLTGDQLVALTTRFSSAGTLLDDDPARNPQPGQQTYGSPGNGYVRPRLEIFDFTAGTWTATAEESGVNLGSEPPPLSCVGDTAIVAPQLQFTPTMRTYSLANGAWATPKAPPVPPAPGSRISTGSELVFAPTAGLPGAPAQIYRPSDDSWRTVDDFPGVPPKAVWSGTQIVAYSTDPSGVFAYTLPPAT